MTILWAATIILIGLATIINGIAIIIIARYLTGEMMAKGEAIYVGWPSRRGRKECGACGKVVDGNCYVVRAKAPNRYVCNAACGVSLITSTDKAPIIIKADEPITIKGRK